MAPPGNRRPSDPKHDAVHLDDDDAAEPTTKLTALDSDGVPVRPRISAPREALTVPAPPQGVPVTPGQTPPRIFTSRGVRAVTANDDAAAAKKAADTGEPRWEALLDPAFDEGPAIETTGNDDLDLDLDWPLEDAHAVDPPATAERPVASPSTNAMRSGRLATMGPEPEFTFSFEKSAEAVSPPSPVNSDPRGPSGDDLSWSPVGVASNASAANPARRAIPSAIPLALDPIGAEATALVERASGFPPGMEKVDPRREMHERLALGDFTGALSIAESILSDAGDDTETHRVAEECRSRLTQMYISRLGGLDMTPVMAVPRSELKWLSLDHRAGFLLSQLDGSVTIEEVMDTAGMPALEVLRTVWELMNQRVIELKKPRR